MGSPREINETLVANLALLAGGTCCLLGGPAAVNVFGVLAAPAVGIGSWGLAKWFKRFQNKNPESHKAIRRIQDRVNAALTGDAAFADAEPEDLNEADNQLSKLAAQFWPAPKQIAALAAEMDDFPDAIARYVMDEINGSAFATGLFEKPPILAYAKRVLTLSLEAALTDRNYFETLEPQLFMKQLSLTGQIGRDVAKFTEDLATAQNVIGDALTRIEGKLDNANEKLDRLLDQLVPKTGASEEETENIKHTIAEMLLSDRQASMDAVAELMADPAQPAVATNRLKQAIAEQSDTRKEATRNEIALLEEIVAINYFTNGPEAVLALEKIIALSPDDANSWNRLGILQRRLGNLDAAITAYESVLRLAKTTSDKMLEAVAYGNLGNVAQTRGDLDGAVRYYQQALVLNEELGCKEGMANNYSGLGIVARVRGDLDGAVRYYEQSLAIETELGRKEGMASGYGNLGNVALTRGDLDSAVRYYEQSLALNQGLSRKEGMAIQHANLGLLEVTRGNLRLAREHWETALDLFTQVGAAPQIASVSGLLKALDEAEDG